MGNYGLRYIDKNSWVMTLDTNCETVLMTLESITPYDKNPRSNDSAVDAVAVSIKEFGFRQPIVVDDKGVIIVGHTRWKAARKLGLVEADGDYWHSFTSVIERDKRKGEWCKQNGYELLRIGEARYKADRVKACSGIIKRWEDFTGRKAERV